MSNSTIKKKPILDNIKKGDFLNFYELSIGSCVVVANSETTISIKLIRHTGSIVLHIPKSKIRIKAIKKGGYRAGEELFFKAYELYPLKENLKNHIMRQVK